MSKKTGTLFDYCNNTLDLMSKGIIPVEVGKAHLEAVTKEIDDVYSLFYYLNNIFGAKRDYWAEFIFKEDKDVIAYFEYAAYTQTINDELVSSLVDRFLKMPPETKKHFYSKNFVEHKQSEKAGIDYVCISGKALQQAEPSSIVHNLPSILLIASRFGGGLERFERVCVDMKKTLKLSNKKFLDVYGATLVFAVDFKVALMKWNSWEIDKRRELQEIYTLKFFHRYNFEDKAFLSYVDSGRLPCNLRYPRGNKYFMSNVISNQFNPVMSYLSQNNFKIEEFNVKTNEAINSIKELFIKYDLSFINKEIFKIKREEFIKAIGQKKKYNDPEYNSQLQKTSLEFTMAIDDLYKVREQKPIKKVKI